MFNYLAKRYGNPMSKTVLDGNLYPGMAWQIGIVFLFNTIIAVTLTLVNGHLGFGGLFWLMMVYSQSIGFSILSVIHLLGLFHRDGEKRGVDIAIGVVVGSLLGSLLGGLLTGTLDYLLTNSMSGLGGNLMLGIIFGSAIGHFFISRYRMTSAMLELQQHQNRQLGAEKELAETQLRLLQAQIEPHFLFNTLSNIHSLIETDPRRASTVLAAFSDFLRASLHRSREGETTLGDEVAMINAYMDIQQARMGERLRFYVDVPQALLCLPCPPMLVQPLVENAVVHGIEPQVEGGRVELRVMTHGARLRIEVSDDGAGLASGKCGSGVALENIRARLHALYGSKAALEITAGQSRGTDVVLEIPLEHDNVV